MSAVWRDHHVVQNHTRLHRSQLSFACIAARFFDRSADTKTFKRGMDAHHNPDSCRQLGKEPEQVARDALEVLARRFGLR